MKRVVELPDVAQILKTHVCRREVAETKHAQGVLARPDSHLIGGHNSSESYEQCLIFFAPGMEHFCISYHLE